MTRRSAFAAFTCAGVGLVGVLLLAQAQQSRAVQTVAGVRFDTMPGFVIERMNPPDKTDTYVVLTFDSQGRPVVSKEQDNPRILLDNDGDGIYESEQIWSDRVRNCQGLWFDGPTLYGVCSQAPTPEEIAAQQAAQAAAQAAAAQGGAGGAGGRGGGGGGGGRGGGPTGIFTMTDKNGDDAADTFETVTLTQGGIGEHGPHAIRRGPDGSFSLMSGNSSTVVDANLDVEDSLVIDDGDMQLLEYLPNFGRSARQGAHSAVYRFDRAINKFTVLFGGNRNSYDHAYNLHGEAFLFDSDMEWDINLPWYRDVRTVHGIPGGNYGYRDGSGKFPPWYIDSLPPLRDLGRGSPVGVEVYTSYAYPREFFDALFEADWSRGRLLYTTLDPNGATYRARTDRLEFIHGEPFNITDVEVGPDGLIYFTTGGRNTPGGFWRVRYTGPVEPAPDMTGIWAVVRQPQPLSSWGWVAIDRVKSSMGEAAFGQALERVARDLSARGLDRARALYEMQRHGPAPGAALLNALVSDPSSDVRAAVVFIAGVQGGLARTGQASAGQPAAAVAAAGLRDGDPFVRRRAAEALVRMGQSPDRPSLAPVEDIYALLNDGDRFVRWSGRLLLERTAPSAWRDRVLAETNPLGAIEGMIAWVRVACPATPRRVSPPPQPQGAGGAPAGGAAAAGAGGGGGGGGGAGQLTGADIDPACPAATLQPIVDKQFTLLRQTTLSLEDKIRLARAVQYTAHHVEGGLSASQREQLHGLVVNQFPSGDDRLDREHALLLAYAGQPQAIGEILAVIPYGSTNEPLTIHYLYALRAIEQGWTAQQKEQLADVMSRVARWRGGNQFLSFVTQIFEQLQELYATDAEKQMLYAKVPELAPLTAEELAAIAARAGGAGRGGRGGGGGGGGRGAAAPEAAAPAAARGGGAPAAAGRAGGGGGGRGGGAQNPLAVRRAGQTADRQNAFEEAIFQPQQNLDPAAGRAVFESSCASCHRFGAVGNDHGVAALNLTASPLRASKYAMLEAVVFPDRSVAPELRMTVIETTGGQRIEGVVLQEGQTLSVLTAAGTVTSVQAPQVKSRRQENRSLMTEAQADTINQGQRRNLLAFLIDQLPPSQ
jgi:putative heme-binding domain-containing protein